MAKWLCPIYAPWPYIPLNKGKLYSKGLSHHQGNMRRVLILLALSAVLGEEFLSKKISARLVAILNAWARFSAMPHPLVHVDMEPQSVRFHDKRDICHEGIRVKERFQIRFREKMHQHCFPGRSTLTPESLRQMSADPGGGAKNSADRLGFGMVVAYPSRDFFLRGSRPP